MVKDITGRVFDRLTVISLSHYKDGGIKKNGIKQRNSYWLCKCTCGNDKVVRRTLLTKGQTRSCGCLHKETLSKIASAPRKRGEDNVIDRILLRYKSSAKHRKLDFSLTKEEFKTLIFSNCYYCGIPPYNIFNYYNRNNFFGSISYNGIDRKNNALGYHIYNTVSCCEICNKAKRNLQYKVFIDWVDRLVAHRKEKTNVC